MTYSLNTTLINPISNSDPKNIIILCHGYGGDGKDISVLATYWKNFLPDTLFICPDAPEICKVNSAGFQWFDLSSEDQDQILNESIKAEKIIKKYIEEIKLEFKLNNSQICISGFSQGCMMSINVGLTAEESFNSIVGFSGKL